MFRVLACRMCLTCDIRMYSILNSPLQETYEKLTNLPVNIAFKYFLLLSDIDKLSTIVNKNF
jgi:hypothetical protein